MHVPKNWKICKVIYGGGTLCTYQTPLQSEDWVALALTELDNDLQYDSSQLTRR